MRKILFVTMFFLNTLCFACGGGTGTSSTDQSDEDADDSSANTIDTDKLIGTPFEEFELGDDLERNLFLCTDFRTEKVSDLPIMVFAAYFTGGQEAVVQEAIDYINEVVDDNLFALTDTWSDDVRVIYKVHEINSDSSDTVGYTSREGSYFNDLSLSERIIIDWAIEIDASLVNKWIVVHEIGHAMGLEHCLINYDGNSCDYDALEEDSVMAASPSISDPVLDDFESMMQTQYQILLDHLDDTSGTSDSNFCD